MGRRFHVVVEKRMVTSKGIVDCSEARQIWSNLETVQRQKKEGERKRKGWRRDEELNGGDKLGG